MSKDNTIESITKDFLNLVRESPDRTLTLHWGTVETYRGDCKAQEVVPEITVSCQSKSSATVS